MGILRELERISPDKVIGYVLVGFALIFPCLSFLYFFKLNLFKELEVIKLLLLSLIYSVPHTQYLSF